MGKGASRPQSWQSTSGCTNNEAQCRELEPWAGLVGSQLALLLCTRSTAQPERSMHLQI